MARNPSPALDRPWRRPGALRYALERVRGVAKPPITVTDPPADVVIERDVEVPTRDGTLLRINVFRSAEGGARPVIASIHPYGKDALPRRRGNRWTFSPQYRMLRQTLVVPPQPAHRPIPGRLPTPAAWSCHAALGPTLRRAPADTGGPWVARVAERWLTARVTRAASVTSPSKTPHAVTSPR